MSVRATSSSTTIAASTALGIVSTANRSGFVPASTSMRAPWKARTSSHVAA